MKQFLKKIRRRLLEKKSVKNIRKKEYLKAIARRIYEQKSLKTTWDKKSGKQFFKKIRKKISVRKPTKEYSKLIHEEYLSDNTLQKKKDKGIKAFIAFSEALGIRSVRKNHRQTNFYMVLNNYI